MTGWMGLMVLVGVTVAVLSVAGFSIVINGHSLGITVFAAALLMTASYTRHRVPRLALASSALFETFVMLSAMSVLQYAAAVPASPYIDRSLAAADAAIRFDWLAFYAWTWDHPLVADAQTYAYRLLLPQLVPVLIVLAVLDARAVDRFVRANFVVIALTLSVSAVIPAAGAMAWFHPAHTPITPDSYPVQLDLVRSGALRTLDTRSIVGLIQFPSYHAALAVLVALAFLDTPRWVAVPFWMFEAAIIASAPIMGGHFGIDILAGALLAVTVHIAVPHLPAPRMKPVRGWA